MPKREGALGQFADLRGKKKKKEGRGGGMISQCTICTFLLKQHIPNETNNKYKCVCIDNNLSKNSSR